MEFILRATLLLVFTVNALSANCPINKIAAEELKIALELNNLNIEYGKFFLFNISICEKYQEHGCFFQNPTSPYGLVEIPLHGKDKEEQKERVSTNYQLEQNEAVFLVGCTPPEMEYYSFTSYVYNRCLNAKNYLVFGSLGDPINLAKIKTAEGEKFNSPFALAMSGDAATSTRLQKVLKTIKIGGVRLDLNILPLPDSVYPNKGYMKYGTRGCSAGSESDSFSFLGRFASPKDKAAWNEWIKSPTVHAFRVSRKTEEVQQPYKAPKLTNRETNKTEKNLRLMFGLSRLEKKMLDLIKDQSPQSEVRRSVDTLPALKRIGNVSWGGDCYIGSKVTRKPLNCQGDNIDTVYLTTLPFLRTTSLRDEIYVVGVNHAATNMSTYSNIALMNINKKVGVTAVTNQQYAGSAIDLLQGIVPTCVSKNLFAVKLAYSCDQSPLLKEYCFVMPSEGYPNAKPGDKLAIFERAYLNPYTLVGPAYNQILPIKYIWVRSKQI